MTQYTVIDDQQDFIVVHKFPGVAVQGEGDGLSLVSIVKNELGLNLLFPVHRLDVATSGVVVMAKTKEANQALSLAFKNRQITKYYLAITHKKTTKKQGSVIGDMEKSRGGSYKILRSRNNPAKTHFFSYGLGNGHRLIVLKPESGKTHQLRVALKSLAAPIIGDDRYGGIESDRMYLHAYQLQFKYREQQYTYSQYPISGELFLSDSFTNLLKTLTPLENLHWSS